MVWQLEELLKGELSPGRNYEQLTNMPGVYSVRLGSSYRFVFGVTAGLAYPIASDRTTKRTPTPSDATAGATVSPKGGRSLGECPTSCCSEFPGPVRLDCERAPVSLWSRSATRRLDVLRLAEWLASASFAVPEFRNFIECALSRTDYEAPLANNGQIWRRTPPGAVIAWTSASPNAASSSSCPMNIAGRVQDMPSHRQRRAT